MRSEVLFGDPRIIDCMRLPEAFRSLPRPSSALKPSHPSHSVVTSNYPVPQLESKPMHGFIVSSRVLPLLDYTLHPSTFLRGLHYFEVDQGRANVPRSTVS
jgi:hypothetical protein